MQTMAAITNTRYQKRVTAIVQTFAHKHTEVLGRGRGAGVREGKN